MQPAEHQVHTFVHPFSSIFGMRLNGASPAESKFSAKKVARTSYWWTRDSCIFVSENRSALFCAACWWYSRLISGERHVDKVVNCSKLTWCDCLWLEFSNYLKLQSLVLGRGARKGCCLVTHSGLLPHFPYLSPEYLHYFTVLICVLLSYLNDDEGIAPEKCS